jgi:hypothetical protein
MWSVGEGGIMNRYEDIEQNGALARGKKELLMHLNGEKLTARQAGLGRCYDCMCFFVDGRIDCKCPDCSLYPFMPYSSKPRTKKIVSAENKENSRKRLEQARKKKKAV